MQSIDNDRIEPDGTAVDSPLYLAMSLAEQERAFRVRAAMRDMTDDDDEDDDNGPATGSLHAMAGGRSTAVPRPGAGGPGGPGAAGSGGLEDSLINYNERFAGADPALYRDAVINRTMAALISKAKPNALLRGPAGVGKTRVVEEIARRIANGNGSVPPVLRDKIIYELPLAALISGASMVGEMEARVQAVIEFATDPDNHAILFIDEIHQIVMSDSGANQQYDKVAQQLKPALARGDLHVIGATTSQESRRIDNDPAFARRFTAIGVGELDREQTAEIVESTLGSHTAHYRNQIEVDPSMVPDIIRLADEHLTTLHRPDSALTLLDRTMAAASVRLNSMINDKLMPVGSIMTLNRAMINETAESMHGSDAGKPGYHPEELALALGEVLEQQEVCEEVVRRLTTRRMHLFTRRNPEAWMFAGSSGVGKTRVAEIIAKVMLGTKPILLNMAEYSEAHSKSSLIGSPPGYVGSMSNKEMPFDELEANPHQVIVLDEFEKCHREVANLFLGALNSGTMRMASGKELDFSKALVIATTNAGAGQISKGDMRLGFGASGSHSRASAIPRDRLTKALSEKFSPELLGRFSWLTAFNTIDRDTYKLVLSAAYTRLREEVCEVNPFFAENLPADLDEEQLEELTAANYVREQGARTAEPAVREWIENTALSLSTTLS